MASSTPIIAAFGYLEFTARAPGLRALSLALRPPVPRLESADDRILLFDS
jgi:hypothetical protein